MSPRKILCALCWLVLISVSVGATSEMSPKVKGGVVLGRTLYWLNGNMDFDTLGWRQVTRAVVHDDSCISNSPVTSLDCYKKAGLAIYRLKNASMISLVLLHDLGYRVVILTQWRYAPDEPIKVSAPGMPNEYKEQRLVSDYLWELIDRFTIAKPSGVNHDYRIDLYFADDASSQFKGRELVSKAFEPIHIGKEGRVIHFVGGDYEDIKPKRQLHVAYMIAPQKTAVQQIVGEIEKLMDSMKLDLSYKIPEIIPVAQDK